MKLIFSHSFLPLFLSIIFSWVVTHVVAQCHAETDISIPGGCTELPAGGGTWTGATTYCVTGSTSLSGWVVMDNDDQLIISGTLTTSGQSIQTGGSNNLVHVIGGGTVTGTGNLTLNGADKLVVFGEYNATGDIQLNHVSGASISIGEGGSVSIGNGDIYLNNDNQIYLAKNSSLISTDRIQIQTTSNVCLEENVTFIATNLDVNSPNAFIYAGAGSGTGCVGITGNPGVNSALTATSDITICNAGACGGCSFGSATNPGCTDCVGYLPVELLEFTGARWENGNFLQWTTLSELNNDYFIVERSENGLEYEFLQTLPGAGNSNEIRNYSLLDDDPEGFMFYRLYQVDYDGKTVLVGTVRVGQNKTMQVSIHPNPYQKDLSQLEIRGLAADDEIAVKIHAPTGQLVMNKVLSTNQMGDLLITDQGLTLSKGVYIVVVESQGAISSHPLLVAR